MFYGKSNTFILIICLHINVANISFKFQDLLLFLVLLECKFINLECEELLWV